MFEDSQRNPKWPMSVGNYIEIRRSNRTLDGIGLYTRQDMQLMHGERPERVAAVAVTDSFFPTLGVHPVLGRNFGAQDLRTSARVVILSHRLWATRFERNRHIVGTAIRLDRQPWTVVGVMPEGFQHVGGAYRSPLQGETVAVWRPLALDLPPNGLRHWHYTNVVGRLKAGVTLGQSTDAFTGVMADLRKQFPQANEGVTVDVEPLAQAVTDSSRSTVQLLLAAGALVLLIACVNVTGLCVARVLARRQELAIRQALGARSWRLVRAVLSENIVVGIVGGTVGLALAASLLPALRALMPPEFPRLHEIRLSPAAVGFALMGALAVSLVAGLLPALRQSRQDARTGLAEDDRTASGSLGTRRLRAGLVVAEIALACLLCIGTTLLVRSAMQLAARDHGFSADRVLSFSLALPGVSYNKPEQIVQLFDELVRGRSRMPGVRAAGIATNLPWTGYDENTSFDLVGRPAPSGDSPQARFPAATPGFFQALRLRLLRGRLIDERDGAQSPLVVVVNDALARRWFPAGDAIGQRLDIWGKERQIVGVVADVRDHPADAGAEPAFWWPMSQQPFTGVRVVLRTEGDPLSLAGPAAAVIRRLDSELPASEVQTMEDIASDALGERRFALWLFQAFSVLALVLAAFGIYGLLAHDVQQRRRELGVRMALGATRAGLVGMVLSNGARLSALGILLGLLAAPAGLGALSALLFGVTSSDPA
ncbi:MAG: FtsX-like permease family protein, partial [Acidobacteria bacterium]